MTATAKLHDPGQSLWLDSINAPAARLQDQGAAPFVKTWYDLMTVLASKADTLGKAA